LKIKFIFNMRTTLKTTALLLLAAPPPASAQAVYLTARQALTEFFPNSERVTYFKVSPSAEQQAHLAARLGYDPRRPSQTFYVGLTGGRIDGYAVVDEERGQSLPITFAVLLDAQAHVRRMEILAYREPRGDEVRSPRFREQFVGKGPGDALRSGDDIAAVSGATISSRAMAVGVRRAVVMLEELVLQGAAGGRPLSP
jgi:H+/Na+-translocating ferredoxin:NAD+ oxidoreductase subunit G